ncbi:hypothetical protein NLU13_5278 [Sarocladium strictum]|uniref:Purple acid phosphatase n=1 Tax=Sarocladium strictum TaxID=5046 RepID=A0AA39GGL2_SARSR|nr:hypothetical protein NLU13_5278 [Sarocladium strictum]
MKSITTSGLVGAFLAVTAAAAPTVEERDVDTAYPYTGPDVPIGDWVDQTVNGNGKGFPRLVEKPAVQPKSSNPTNNVNVISLAWVPGGVNIHYQTPFGLGEAPSVQWGTSSASLTKTAIGSSHSYDRTPPCSAIAAVTQCSQYFHEVQISGLKPSTTYYYQIPAANGTTESDVLSFTTAAEAGDKKSFSVAVVNDMGYTNAKGTHEQLLKLVNSGTAFTWHGGDISYADDWYSGILPCEDDWPVCYNGSSTELPGPAPVPDEYKDAPLPKGEVANQGGPQGGDMSVIYESNWDLWQQWMSDVTMKAPYMVLPGNHEATCAEFDGGNNTLTAYLNDDKSNSTAAKSGLTYYSCPPSQRNFTAFQHRFRMPGEETGGVGNFWYSFDYGLAHFVSIDGETDYPNSPEWSFARDLAGKKGDHVTPKDTFVTDSGPFGKVDGDLKDNKAYEQWNWLNKDLAAVDRTKTPWVFVMSHRPLYSSEVSKYQLAMRAAWEDLMLEHGVDAYIAGHIHWYERLLPLGRNGTIDVDSIKDNSTYLVNNGKSITHLTNGAAGNIESHSTPQGNPILNFTQVLDYVHFGLGKLTVVNETVATWDYVVGDTGDIRDHLTLIKPTGASTGSHDHSGPSSSNSTSSSSTSTSSSSSSDSTASSSEEECTLTTQASAAREGVTTTTEVVTAYTTWCPAGAVVTAGSHTYTVTEATSLTITDCPCTLTHTLPAPAASTWTPAGNSTGTIGSPSGNGTATAGSSGNGGGQQGSGSQGGVPQGSGVSTGTQAAPTTAAASRFSIGGLLAVSFIAMWLL